MKNYVGLCLNFLALNERFGKFTTIVFHLFMGILWIGIGTFFIYDYYLSKQLDLVYKEHPLWIPFNIVAILYGAWRFHRAYSIYKSQ